MFRISQKNQCKPEPEETRFRFAVSLRFTTDSTKLVLALDALRLHYIWKKACFFRFFFWKKEIGFSFMISLFRLLCIYVCECLKLILFSLDLALTNKFLSTCAGARAPVHRCTDKHMHSPSECDQSVLCFNYGDRNAVVFKECTKRSISQDRPHASWWPSRLHENWGLGTEGNALPRAAFSANIV